MGDTTTEFSTLLESARAGSQSAAEELVARYGREILRTVRRRMNRELRARFDSTDFVQAVWASFFSQIAGNQSITDPASLARYLLRMAQNKIVTESRRSVYSTKRDMRREKPLDAEENAESSCFRADDPTPSQIAIGEETWKQITEGCSDRDVEILKLRVNGHTYREIAESLGFDERTIRRIVERRLKSVSSR